MDRQPRSRPLRHWLATLACLAAIAVRLVLPTLHTHADEPALRGHGHMAAAAAACSCGHHHAPPRPMRDGERARDGTALPLVAGVCLACEFELATPGAPPPLPIVAPTAHAESRTPRLTAACTPHSPLDRAHPCRAPPPAGPSNVFADRCRAV